MPSWLPIGGRGRAAAWAVLLAFLVMQVFAGGMFETPRLALFDLYQRSMPRHRDGLPVMIVAIDDASLAAIGQWPWPRQIVAKLIDRIAAGKTLVLGVDALFPEPDKTSPEQFASQARELSPSVVQQLKEVRPHDDSLRQALADAGRISIGVGGVEAGVPPADAGIFAPVRFVGATGSDNPVKRLPHYLAPLRSIAALDQAAAGHGLISVVPDADNVFRRLPMVSVVDGRAVPSLAADMLRLAANAPRIDLHLRGDRAEGVTIGPLSIPTEADGSLWINFTETDPARFVSAKDVLAGQMPTGLFDGKLVLISVDALGTLDQRRTPAGFMPGTEIYAQLLENVLGGSVVRRPGWTAAAEPSLTALIGVVLIVAMPFFRLRWQVPILLTATAILTVLGALFWSRALLLLDVATPGIGIALAMVALLGGSLSEADSQRRRLRRELESRRLTAARNEGELEAGRRIQMSILPRPETVTDPRFDLGALMVPARQIGGDLYDFFKIDDDHLFLLIGDVSGKGVPASLFMAVGKSLFKSCALRGESRVAAITAQANAEISRDNPEMLFITAFAGILDLVTGELRFCNAGQDPPLLLRPGEPARFIDIAADPALCVLDDFEYATETLTLLPGDVLCLTTDGVAEAMTAEGVLMGRERVLAAVADVPADADAATVTRRVHAAVEAYVAGAEASDDLTILTVKYRADI